MLDGFQGFSFCLARHQHCRYDQQVAPAQPYSEAAVADAGMICNDSGRQPHAEPHRFEKLNWTQQRGMQQSL